MIENGKKIKTIFWLSLALGSVAFGVLIAWLDPPSKVRMILVGVWIVGMGVIHYILDMRYYKELGQRLTGLNRILIEQNNPDLYIEELNKLLEGEKKPALRQVRFINLGAAYCNKGDYQAAKEHFLQVDTRKLSGGTRIIYWADLALAHFYLREEAEACAIMASHEKEFAKMAGNPRLGGVFASLDIFSALAEGEYEEAEELLEKARGMWNDERSVREFNYLEERCREARGRIGVQES